MTTFGDMVSHMGGVPVMSGIPFGPTSKVFFVAPGTGSDGNNGRTPKRAFATLSKAHSVMTANNNDVCFLIAESNTAADTTDYQSATLTWSKDLCHLIGIGAPSKYSNRARIAQLSTATGVSPLVNITADGCVFKNFSIFHGVDDATSLIACQVTGTRNYFENIHFAGIGHATMSATGAASLKCNGDSENVFKDCIIGLDTIERDGDPAGELWFDGGSSRNWFEDCMFTTYLSADNATVKVEDSTGIDRTVMFKRCVFFAKSTNKATAQTEVFDLPAISQGAILLVDSYAASDGGAVDWDGDNRGIIWNSSPAAAASAAGGILTNQ